MKEGSVMEKSGKPPVEDPEVGGSDKAATKAVGGRKRSRQEQKLKILETAKEISIKKAAKLTGIHYTTVYDWKRQLEARGKEGFLAAYRSPSPGKGIKRITEGQERGVLATWE